MEQNQVDFLNTVQKYWTPEKITKVIGAKKYPITPIEAPQLLRILGILNADSSLSPSNMNKFIQINHMFTLIEPHITELKNRHKLLNIFDAGCGKSYLTFLLAWYFYKNKSDDLNSSVQIFGVDSNQKIIQECVSKAKKLSYEQILHFESNSILNYEWKNEVRPHCVVSLHACDTATDMALAFAVKQKSDFIAVAPCCQAELARKWKESPLSSHPLNPVFQSPQLRREIASQMTDALRVCLMRANGYEVTCTEFVDSAHTPKNRLITCIRRGNYLQTAKVEYEELKAYLGGHSIMLENLLKPEKLETI